MPLALWHTLGLVTSGLQKAECRYADSGHLTGALHIFIIDITSIISCCSRVQDGLTFQYGDSACPGMLSAMQTPGPRPRVGSRVERLDQIHFLAWCKRWLKPGSRGLSYLILGFFWASLWWSLRSLWLCCVIVHSQSLLSLLVILVYLSLLSTPMHYYPRRARSASAWILFSLWMYVCMFVCMLAL